MVKALVITFLFITVSACIPTETEETTTSIEDNTLNNSSRVTTILLPVGSFECEFGGVQINSGFDQNDNKILDISEVTTSKVVCNGNNGFNSLIRIFDEPEGGNCPYGGKRIIYGLDTNSDSSLSSNEIEDTQYLCNLDQILTAPPSCSVTDNENGSIELTCPDGTTATILNGTNGTNGTDGVSCSVSTNENGSATITCEDGTTSTVQDGTNGTNGTDGVSCSVSTNENGSATITCEDGTTSTVQDGTDGADGTGSGLVAELYCTGGLGSWPLSSIQWQYHLYLLENGDVYVTAGVISGDMEDSKTAIYSPNHAEYTTAPILLEHYPFAGSQSNTYWVLAYDRQSNQAIVSLEGTDTQYDSRVEYCSLNDLSD